MRYRRSEQDQQGGALIAEVEIPVVPGVRSRKLKHTGGHGRAFRLRQAAVERDEDAHDRAKLARQIRVQDRGR